eukprot:GHVR01033352.1.p1 GENE.GHVR01033352.1~~GHVR01033352.1.p1  ORF type:complete len:170 (+),score=9.51 GHVR01033352.1:2-511(+)
MFGFPEELWMGEHNAVNGEGQSETPVPVFVRNGNVYWVVHPIIYTDHGRAAAVKARRVGDFHEIAFYNYEGEKRPFTDYELSTTLNGFALVAEDASANKSFEAFRLKHGSSELIDVWHPGGGARLVIYRQGELELSMSVSPMSEGIRYATINGDLAPEDKFSLNSQSVI